MAKETINTFGPELTQTDLSVESVGLNPLFGSGSIQGLSLGNPDGFDGQRALALENIELDLDLGSLFSGDAIVIEKLHIIGPSVAYERTFRSSNVAEILNNVRGFSERVLSSSETAEPEPQAEAATAHEIKIIIKELVVDGGEVGLTMGGQTFALPMPRVEQYDIGVDSGGVGPDEALGEVINLVLKSIGAATAEASKQIANEGADTVKRLSEGLGNFLGGGE